MAVHEPGPYFLRLHYQTGAVDTHTHLFPIADAREETDGSFSLLCKDGTWLPAQQAVSNTLVSYLRGMLAADSGYTYFELCHQGRSGANSTIVQAGDVGEDGQGTAAGAHVPMLQLNVSFRSRGGNHFSLRFMECPGVANTMLSAPFTQNLALAEIAMYFCGRSENQPFICARDGTFLTIGVRALSKTNDYARRKAHLG